MEGLCMTLEKIQFSTECRNVFWNAPHVRTQTVLKCKWRIFVKQLIVAVYNLFVYCSCLHRETSQFLINCASYLILICSLLKLMMGCTHKSSKKKKDNTFSMTALLPWFWHFAAFLQVNLCFVPINIAHTKNNISSKKPWHVQLCNGYISTITS